jgi:hypothetical protein
MVPISQDANAPSASTNNTATPAVLFFLRIKESGLGKIGNSMGAGAVAFVNLRTQIAQTTELEKALQLASEASAGMHGVLHMADGLFKGAIYFESGRVVAAEIKGINAVSLQALQEIVQHREATFLYDKGSAPANLKRISFAFQELLKEGLNFVENQEPSDPSVVGKAVDGNALSTLTNTVMVDASLLQQYNKKRKDE